MFVIYCRRDPDSASYETDAGDVAFKFKHLAMRQRFTGMKQKIAAIATGAMALTAAISAPTEAGACSRVLYKGLDSLMVVGRSLDWKTPIPTNLYVYPRGMEKKGSDRPGAVTWTSVYGAVYAVGYDGGITEGMNEMGLVINGLFCTRSDRRAHRPQLLDKRSHIRRRNRLDAALGYHRPDRPLCDTRI